MSYACYDCIIIGGGAAGLTAAVTAAELGKKTLLLERNNSLGKKLLITGKGRCNLTNNCGLDEFTENVPTNSRFLYSAYSNFSSRDCMDFFEELGVPLKTERGNRVFPVSDKSADIVFSLENACRARGVTIKNNVKVSSLIIEGGQVKGVNCVSGTSFYAESVLVATGGKSYPKTGSDGDGYKFAKAAGHTIKKLRPSLVPFVAEESYCAVLEGLSLKNVNLKIFDAKLGKSIFSEQGEMLFTRFGISGPLVLSASAHISDMERGRYKAFIDLKPALDEKALNERILRDFAEIPNRLFSNSLSKLLPNKLIQTVVQLSGVAGDKPVHSVTKPERAALVSLLKAFPVTIRDFRPFSEAVITSGGVDVAEISPKTMESKLVKSLYFAGEVLDLDGYTGGFNLQIAFCTAVCAANNM
ncbi:MAG: NAD(P)/FAD-dependent oxidoreductase [Oscillospiraceae bacterium]|nr:NAD(P)/FAD-dependent oxidoreductase [Oscillospiraceae bacterium]